MNKEKNIDVCINSLLPAPYNKIHIFNRSSNYSLAVHSHEKIWHLNYIMSGSIELYLGDKMINVCKNHFFVVPAGVPHKIVSKNGYCQIGVDICEKHEERNIFRMISAYFSSNPVELNVTPPAKSFDALKELAENPLPLNISKFLNIYEGIILDAISIMASDKKTISAKLTQIINNNNPFTLTLHDICKITSYSKTQIERMAKKELGCGITSYLNNIKINEICSLLQSTELSMTEIACRVGLYDASHLITFFKRYMGITPGLYRKNHNQTIS